MKSARAQQATAAAAAGDLSARAGADTESTGARMAEDSLSPGESVTAGTTPETAASQAPGAAPASGSGQTAATAASGSGEPPKRPYPAPAELPTQQGPQGIRYDFNDGCRVAVPEGKQPWKIRLSDLDTGNILYETELKAGRVNSTKRYYV